MIDVDAIVSAVARDLCKVSKDEIGSPYLMWPSKRDDSTRVSEQESKILLCQTLERMRHVHSIETPTRERYQQKGKGTISGRIDTTVYSERDRSKRVLNIELKAGNPPVEKFRKDFEKLLREKVEGLWLHTVAVTDAGTMPSIFEKAREAFRIENEAGHMHEADHSLHFAFVLLDSSEVVASTIDLKSGAEAIDARFLDHQSWRRRTVWEAGQA